MKLRTRLIVAFLILSVLPLGAVTAYGYFSTASALRDAAAREADLLAVELSERMQVVTSELSARVEHLMDLPSPAEPAAAATAPTAPVTKPATPTSADTPSTMTVSAADAQAMQDSAAKALGDVAMLLTQVELQGMRRGGGGRSGPPQGSEGSRGSEGSGGSRGSAGTADSSGSAGSSSPTGAMRPAGGPTRGRPPRSGELPAGGFVPPLVRAPGAPNAPKAPGAPKTPDAQKSSAPSGPAGSTAPPAELAIETAGDRVVIDTSKIARDLMRDMMPSTPPNQWTPDERQRFQRELRQRLQGISEGIKLSATELQKKADEAKQHESDSQKASDAAKSKIDLTKAGSRAADAIAAGATAGAAAASAFQRHTVISGNRMDVTVEQNGKVVRTANAQINLDNLLSTIFATTHRDAGEVPFAVAKDGHLYTQTDADRARIAPLGAAVGPDGPLGKVVKGDWIVVTTKDPTGSGLRLGIARPVGDSLSALRRTVGRSVGFGLLFIALALVAIVPTSRRLTRELTTLTQGVEHISKGDYSARVDVPSQDEIGELAAAFNKMAADVEVHQRSLVEQERIKRELELGRQIQSEMLPREPLRLGLTEVRGVSVPAREVGGDFFNYFALPHGDVALLVGDVSGKGVGAALLMANIQSALRTRLGMGQDLAAITDAIDREIEATAHSGVFATLFLGIYSPVTKRLRYVNAGHNPQFVLRAGGGIGRMGSSGLPVGMLAGRGYREESLQLTGGDLLFFYTDGCVETENTSDEMFGTDRLESLLVSAQASAPEDVLARVEQEVREFRGAREPFDDATMMAVRIG